MTDEITMQKLLDYCDKKGAKYNQIKLKDSNDDRHIKHELENL